MLPKFLQHSWHGFATRALFLLLFPTLLPAADLTIANDGKTDWTVVMPVHNSPAEQLAESELRKYLNQMTGADFGHAIPANQVPLNLVVGRYDHLDAEEQSQCKLPADPEAWCISQPDETHIYLVGRTGRSTLYAVYNFLDSLGCRFLAPTFDHYKGSAEFIPHSPTLTVPTAAIRASSPSLKFRKLYIEEGHSHTPDNLKQLIEWMPKVGYNTLVCPTDYQGHGTVKWDNFRAAATPELQNRELTLEVGGHGYQNFLNSNMESGQLFSKHPEFFNQDATGHRRPQTDHYVFCTSNADAVSYLTGNFVSYLQSHPEIQIYDFWPPDGAQWCECEKCKALGSPSDRQAILLSQIQKSIAAAHLKVRLEMIAYASYIAPPEHTAIDPSVLVDFCPIGQEFDRQINDPSASKNTRYVSALSAWRSSFKGDLSIYSYYRKYAWDSLPVLLPHYIQRDLQYYATLPTQGVSCYSEPGDWFTYELNHYCLPALAWNPNLDIDALIKKFATARYGEAAPAALAAYSALEDITRTTCSVPATPKPSIDQLKAGIARLRQAQSALSNLKNSINLTRLSLTLDYAIGDLESQLLARNGDLPAARTRAATLFHLISAHLDDGVFLSRNGRLSEERLYNRLGVIGKPPTSD